MRKMVFLLVMCVLVSSTICYAYDNEVSLRTYYLFPGMDEFDFVFGVEGQGRVWLNPNLGLAIAAGVSTLEVDDSIQVEDDFVYKFEGSASLISFGPSVLVRPLPENNPVELTIEGGLRYVIVNSDIDIYGEDAFYYYFDEVDLENALVGILGVEIGFPISEWTRITSGLGYQFDVDKGKAEISGIDFGDSELDGYFVNLGVSTKF